MKSFVFKKMFWWISHKRGAESTSTPQTHKVLLQFFLQGIFNHPNTLFFLYLYTFWSRRTNTNIANVFFFPSFSECELFDLFIRHPSRHSVVIKGALVRVNKEGDWAGLSAVNVKMNGLTITHIIDALLISVCVWERERLNQPAFNTSCKSELKGVMWRLEKWFCNTSSFFFRILIRDHDFCAIILKNVNGE